jgi:hypothetical protein
MSEPIAYTAEDREMIKATYLALAGDLVQPGLIGKVKRLREDFDLHIAEQQAQRDNSIWRPVLTSIVASIGTAAILGALGLLWLGAQVQTAMIRAREIVP